MITTFLDILWGNIAHAYEWYYSRWFVIRMLLWIAIIFVLGIIFEIIRQNTFEKYVFSRKCIQNIMRKTDEFLKNQEN